MTIDTCGVCGGDGLSCIDCNGDFVALGEKGKFEQFTKFFILLAICGVCSTSDILAKTKTQNRSIWLYTGILRIMTKHTNLDLIEKWI